MARNILTESETAEFRQLATAWFAVRERLPVVKSEAGQRSMMDADGERNYRSPTQAEIDDLPMYETKFPSAEALIANFKERADDIEKVQVIPDVLAFTGPNGDLVVMPDAGMLIHKVNGHRDIV